MSEIAQKVASRFLLAKRITRTAGEVRFIKDRSGDKNEWGWGGTPGPTDREILPTFEFQPTKLKPLAKTLRAALAALGHAQSAHSTFVRIKSATISPDGSLGGKGYIQKISEMRRLMMNAIEALSSFTDTVYDEIHAPHWDPAVAEQSSRERKQVKEIMQDAEEIREDPEDWAGGEESEMDSPSGKKTASRQSLDGILIRRIADRHLRRTA
jgi:hypothetical protein